MDLIFQYPQPPEPSNFSQNLRWKRGGNASFDPYLLHFRGWAPWKVETVSTISRPRCLKAPLPADTESLILRFRPGPVPQAAQSEHVDGELLNWTTAEWTEFPMLMLGPRKTAAERHNLLEETLEKLGWDTTKAMQVSKRQCPLLIEDMSILYMCKDCPTVAEYS
jgi:hypothetical protein